MPDTFTFSREPMPGVSVWRGEHRVHCTDADIDALLASSHRFRLPAGAQTDYVITVSGWLANLDKQARAHDFSSPLAWLDSHLNTHKRDWYAAWRACPPLGVALIKSRLEQVREVQR